MSTSLSKSDWNEILQQHNTFWSKLECSEYQHIKAEDQQHSHLRQTVELRDIADKLDFDCKHIEMYGI